MAHKEWCGKSCDECQNPCALDESISCSPDCQALNPDGSRDEAQCVGCDAILTD